MSPIAMHRVMAIVRRHFLLSFRRFNRLFNVLYWPFLNIVIWGITSIWIQNFSDNPHLIETILLGLVLWQIVFRINLETARGLFEELLHHNVVNIFSTPLTLAEWILAMMIMGFINMIVVMACSSLAVWLLYNVNMLSLGWHLIPFMLLLLMSGWFIGFFICGLLIYWGLKAQDFIASVGYIFAPFSAVFYPLDALPLSAQRIGNVLPTTPVFEAMRELINTGTYSSQFLIKSLVLNIVYLILSIGFFYLQFARSKQKGLGQLE